MKALIVGGTNLLARYLTLTKPDDVDLTSTWYTNYSPGCSYQLDITNPSQVSYVFSRVKPDVALHLAAIGDVDYAESHYQETYAINVLGVRNVLAACKDYGTRFVYTSSNAVFAGDNPPYAEDSPRQPVNRYGATRKQAEDLVTQTNNWLILRLFLLFGWSPPGARTNWVQSIIRSICFLQEPISLVSDCFWQPTFTEFAADGIWKTVQAGLKNEVLHMASPDIKSLHTLGLRVADVFNGGDASLIKPITSTQLKGVARRPVDSTYNLEKSRALGLTLPGLAEGLVKMRGRHGSGL